MAKKNVFQTNYARLNPRQKQAVDTIDGPVMVIAGPGTGKTQILTLRIANILAKTDTNPGSILALTFTSTAASEMRDRLVSLIGPTAYAVNIYTFHALCSEIIQSYPDEFISSTLAEEPLSDLKRVEIINHLIDTTDLNLLRPVNSPHYYAYTITSSIQTLKREGVSPEKLADYARSSLANLKSNDSLTKTNRVTAEKTATKLLELSRVYEAYQKELRKTGLYDFEDMINLVVEKLEKNESFRRTFQEIYQYILVDEYQDTNSSQNQFIHTLAEYWGESANLFVVGDDDQSIYRFQGASLENVLYFTTQFPTAEIIVLNTAYRSHQFILDAASQTIKRNQTSLTHTLPQIDKTFTSARTPKRDDTLIKVAPLNSSIQENYFVTQTIKDWIKEGTPPQEIAVIYRNNRDGAELSRVLAKSAIPHQILGGGNLMADTYLAQLLRLLQVVNLLSKNTEDDHIFELLNFEFLGLDYLAILKLSRLAHEKKTTLWQLALNPKCPGLDQKSYQPIHQFFVNLNSWSHKVRNLTVVESVETIVTQSGYLTWWLARPDKYFGIHQLNTFFTEVKRFNHANPKAKFTDLITSIDLLETTGARLTSTPIEFHEPLVSLMTAHRAKGLEFDRVIIYQCTDGHWGNQRTRELIKLPPELVVKSNQLDPKTQRLEDERRLFYVALTRAKDQLLITYAKHYQETDSKPKNPSLFVSEIKPSSQHVLTRKELSLPPDSDIYQALYSPNPDLTLPREASYLKPIIKNLKLSVTGLNTYLDCPYKFKLNNLYRVPHAKKPHLAYGTAVHKCLEQFYRQLQKTSKAPTKTWLIDKFKSALKTELLNPTDHKERLALGQKVLTLYYDSYAPNFTTPIDLEVSFGAYRHQPHLDDIALSGKVDKIEWLDQAKKTVKVIDYKTGKIHSKNSILGLTKSSSGHLHRQLVFYQLLFELSPFLTYRVKAAELDFIGPDGIKKPTKQSLTITRSDITTLKKTIKDSVKAMRKYTFDRTTDYTNCTYCEYRRHCWPEGIPKASPQKI